jgi:hypothetical protein
MDANGATSRSRSGDTQSKLAVAVFDIRREPEPRLPMFPNTRELKGDPASEYSTYRIGLPTEGCYNPPFIRVAVANSQGLTSSSDSRSLSVEGFTALRQMAAQPRAR